MRGFAVVHCIGILTSMFSAVFFSRGLVNLWYGRQKKLKSVSIGTVWRPAHGWRYNQGRVRQRTTKWNSSRSASDIPFMRNALIFNVISFLTFAAAVFFLFTRGLHLSVEFTGGTVMEVATPRPADVEKVRRPWPAWALPTSRCRTSAPRAT